MSQADERPAIGHFTVNHTTLGPALTTTVAIVHRLTDEARTALMQELDATLEAIARRYGWTG